MENKKEENLPATYEAQTYRFTVPVAEAYNQHARGLTDLALCVTCKQVLYIDNAPKNWNEEQEDFYNKLIEQHKGHDIRSKTGSQLDVRAWYSQKYAILLKLPFNKIPFGTYLFAKERLS